MRTLKDTMNATEQRYAKRFPLNSAVKYSDEYRKKFPHIGIGAGFVSAIKFRDGMIPAIAVSDGNGVILYGIMANHLESVERITVEL